MILGRRVGETNEAGVVTRFGYDGLGRLNAVTNAHGAAEATWATYAYDEAGNQTNQVDALERVTHYEYDQLGRRIRRILPGNQTESFVYNPVGNLLAHTNFINTAVITNEYDLMNRLVRKWSGAVQFENYGYSATGQRTARTDGSGSYTWVYDLRDRVRTNTTPVAALYYEYDRQGNLTNLLTSTTSGTWIAYEYDALNRVTNVIDNRLTGTKDTAYTFDSVGNLKTIKYPTALTNLWEYDARNRLTNGAWKQNATTRGSFYYELAVGGNRTNLSETVNGVSRTYAWSYDQLYRLTNEVISGSGAVSYAYDRVSNRTNRQSTISQLSTTNYTYNTNDWLTTDVYDENGNTRTNGSTTYQYDWANRLTNSGSISIVYNADGHRIKKATATTTTLYLVDALNLTGYPQVLEEHTLSGSVTNLFRWYIYGLDLIGWHEGVLLRYCGYDGHGSVRFAVNGSGTVGVTYAYDAYGTVIASTGSSPSPYRYAGEQWDADLGLYFLRARYMKTDTGRFLTKDAYEGCCGNPPSLQKYTYTEANPVNNIDPSGAMSIAEAMTAVQVDFSLAQAQQVPPSKASALGACGCDLTDAVKSTLNAVEATFKGEWGQDKKKQLAACDSLDNFTVAPIAWDMDINVPITTAVGPCKFTATFEKKCFKISAINYAFYGRISRLCFDKFGNGIPGSRWSLEYMIGQAQIHKRGFHGDFSDEARQAYAFTSYGFGSGLKYAGKDYAITSCKPSDQKCKQDKFKWKWLPNKPDF